MEEKKLKEKLKTLKEIEKIVGTGNCHEEDFVMGAISYDLRAEAVKELKCSSTHFYQETGVVPTDSVKRYIMWKNNLTKEDLV